MSATYEQRVFRWGAWYGKAEFDGLDVIGYEHQCGAANLVDFSAGYDGSCCSGCRFEIQRPDRECEPIYRPTPAASVTPLLGADTKNWLDPDASRGDQP